MEKISLTVIELRAKDGHSIFKMNVDTKQITKVPFSKLGEKILRKAFIEPEQRCLYCSALNEKNAIKHFKNQVNFLMK